MTNERNSVMIAEEAIYLLIYAWNSAPVAGTDLSRSLVAVGREFHFPIDFSASKHLELTSTPASVQSYAKDQAHLLSTCRDVAKVLLDEHRTYHRELVNASRPDPRVYEVGDIVFAERAVRSDKGRGLVGKLQYSYDGPWRVIKVYDGASYELEHCLNPKRTTKKHAAFISPYPTELVPFEPIDGPDNVFGQIHKPLAKSPFVKAGLEGFTPLQPYKLPANYASTHDFNDFYWPSLKELNDELCPFPWFEGERERHLSVDDSIESAVAMYQGPPPTPPTLTPSVVPSIEQLAPAIVRSIDKLFFISHTTTNAEYREWRLVRVALEDSMSLRPTCLQDGRFLVEFYIMHTSDSRYNGINQRYWLQYHRASDITTPTLTSETHLIRPSDSSPQLAARHGLVPFRRWVTLTHESTFIHGPFDFTTIHGRKSRDRIGKSDWIELQKRQSMFDNRPPSLDLPTFSIHVDRGVHTTHSSEENAQQLIAVASYHLSTSEQVLQ